MNENIRRFWGGTLRRISLSADVKEVAPKATIDFLTSIGLPTDAILFDHKRRLLLASSPLPTPKHNEDRVRRTTPYFEIDFQNIRVVSQDDTPYLHLGHFANSDLRLHLVSGEIFYMFEEERPWKNVGQIETVYLNHDIQSFLRFFIAIIEIGEQLIPHYSDYIAWLGKRRDHPEASVYAEMALQSIRKLFQTLESRFRAIDNTALDHEAGGWKMYIDELKTSI